MNRPDEDYRGVMEGDERFAGAEVRDTQADHRGAGVETAGERRGVGSGRKVRVDAGLEQGRELLLMLPPEFVRGYEDLFHRALRVGDEGKGEIDARKAELGKARGLRVDGRRGGGMGGAKAGKKTGAGGMTVRDDRALGEKQRIDRALRKLARSLRDSAGAGTGKETVARCGEGVGPGGKDLSGCGKWVEKTWRYCPFCGRQQRGPEQVRQ